jgi:hypothetical protein
MNPAIEEIPFDSSDIEADPARIALPVLLDLLPCLPELGAFQPRGSMTLLRVTLRLLRRIPDEDDRAAAVRSVFIDTTGFSGQLILLQLAGHREHIGAGLISLDAAAELEDELRDALTALPPADFAAQDRIARLASFMAETDKGKAALQTLAEDNKVMLVLLANCSGVTRGQELGAAAVQETKVLPWEELTGWFSADALVRRIAELVTAVADEHVEVSEEELAALSLAVNYATGNRPQTPWERMARGHSADADTGDADGRLDHENTDPADEAAAASLADDGSGSPVGQV